MTFLWTLLTLVVLVGPVTAAVSQDQVTDLPGLSWKPSFRQFSGYLNATGTKRLHYWFVESQSDPTNDPVVLWLNGGPGCSSMDGLLSEHGPFLIAADGKNLKQNPYSWNNVANMLYLEAPAGVGYSYSADKLYNTTDDQVSLDNFQALKYFFGEYAEYQRNSFFITGESYGGVYVPTLSVRVAQDSSFNFKGFAVGNGLSDYSMNDNSLIYFAYYHGLFSVSLWSKVTKVCCQGQMTDRCDFTKSTDPDCQNALNEIQNVIGGLNIYNLYDECHTAGNVKDDMISINPVQFLFSENGLFGSNYLKAQSTLHIRPNMKVKEVPPCINVTAVTMYLNSAEVRQAIHIPADLPTWEICSGEVGAQYVRQYQTLKNQYNTILSSGKYRVMVYNGDVDMACNFLGDQWFVDSLKQKLVKDWHAWYYDSPTDQSQQVAGFNKVYNNIQFVTIKGAGHMVPTDKPQQAMKMFVSFIQDKPL